MNVVSIPTNVAGRCAIDEEDDLLQEHRRQVPGGIAKAIREKKAEIGQPVLVGTVSIEKSPSC